MVVVLDAVAIGRLEGLPGERADRAALQVLDHQQASGHIARSVPIGEIYRGVLPFVAVDLLRLALILAVPQIVLAIAIAL